MDSKRYQNEIIQRYCNKIDDNVIMVMKKNTDNSRSDYECLSRHLCDNKNCENCENCNYRKQNL